jgi:DNA repair protein RadC
MHIRDWPAAERPREKLLTRGAGVLSDAELLAIFLGSGLRGRDAVTTARELLSAHGPLRALLEHSPAHLAKLPGLGPARACALAAALELGHRHLSAELERGIALSDPQAAGRYFAQRLRGLPHEVFAVLFLDTRHRAIAFEELFRGTLDGAEVHPREVVRRALAHNAAAVIADTTITCLCSDMALSLALLHFPTICKCHRNDANSGDKSASFVTTAKGFGYRSR